MSTGALPAEMLAKYQGAITLDTLCREKQWKAVIDHVRAHPSDVWAKTVAVAGSITLPPLHIACQESAPIQVIKSLIAANPAALQTTSGSQDRLPMHHLLATKSFLADNVVAALVEAYPDACRIADKGGNLPIHLACQALHVTETIFMSILAVYPEGAYARTSSGMYPLHLASSNTDLNTKKTALAALDKGTLYASISKMTSIRLTKEHEAQIKSMAVIEADTIKKTESQAKEERDKLKSQVENLTAQLNIEKNNNVKLRDELKVVNTQHEKKVALVVQKEQANAFVIESQLRSDLAEVQLQNMDFLDQTEVVQADLNASNAMAETLANINNELQLKMEDAVTKMAELERTNEQLVSIQAASAVKSEYILQLEASLKNARTCVLSFAREQERLKSAMSAQKEALADLLFCSDTAIDDTGALTKCMLELVSKIEEYSDDRMDETDSENLIF